MSTRKPFITALVAAIALAGCGGAGAGKGAVVAARPKPAKHRQVEVPEELTFATRGSHERELFLLPTDHPQRLDLRDRLTSVYADELAATPEDDLGRRLELYEQALALHDPADFAADRVSAPLVPMARWVVDVFSRRGEEALVLASLRFLTLAQPDDPATAERYEELREWSTTVRGTIDDPLLRLSSDIDLKRRTLSLVPTTEAAETLAGLYVERHRKIISRFQDDSGQALADLSPFDALRLGHELRSLPLDVIHAFFLVGRVDRAKQHLDPLVEEGAVRAEFVDLVDQMTAGRDRADGYFTLARFLIGAGDLRAGMRACVLARAADRENPRYPLCVGQALEGLGQLECAVDFYVEAAEVAPQVEVYSDVLELVKRALLRLHLDERTEQAHRAIDVGDGLVDSALAAFPEAEEELRMIAASLLFTMGEVEFDDGRIDRARAHMARSHTVLANVVALVKLAEIEFLTNNFQESIDILDRAADVERGELRPTDYWRAIIDERRGDALAAMGRDDEAGQAYRSALARLEVGAFAEDHQPIVAVRKGVLLDRIGDMEASVTAFRDAVRLAPERQATYAEAISFLVIRGRLDHASEFYRLAYNQDRIDDMWKIYFSIWIEGLAMRQGGGTVPLARGYLEHSDGSSWQDQLARYFTGRIDTKALRALARNTGQDVEVDYYAALLDLSAGRAGEARKRLEAVISSDLLGFFEYRMARELLREDLTAPK